MTLMIYPYFGGKNSWLDFILPLLDVPCDEFIGTHAGSAAVEINRPPATLETLNDKDEHIYNFLDVLRRRPEELQHHLLLTPWSRREWQKSLGPIQELDELEWARLFYVRIRQSVNSQPIDKSQGWKVSLRAKSGTGGVNNPPQVWQNAVAQLHEVGARLRNFQLECKSAEYVIARYDGPNALFFVDPPYVKRTRGRKTHRYNHEMTDEQHAELAEQLTAIKGKALLCGYDNPIYNGILKGWHKISFGEKLTPSSSRETTRAEHVWLNYEPPAQQLKFNLEVAQV
jgi:DNA adenine methylase